MDTVYWIKFYEDGKFVTVVGQPHQDRLDAKIALDFFALRIGSSGLKIEMDGEDQFHYDRYGTVCAVKIEEE